MLAVAAGAAGLLSLADEVVEEDDSAEEEALAAPPDFFAPDEEYRSAYQPPPLNCTAGAEIVFSRRPPQCGHSVKGASENFWIFSTLRWQF